MKLFDSRDSVGQCGTVWDTSNKYKIISTENQKFYIEFSPSALTGLERYPVEIVKQIIINVLIR